MDSIEGERCVAVASTDRGGGLCTERSCTELMKKDVQLDGEPSVCASPGGGVSLLYFSPSIQRKVEFIFIALLCNCDSL